MEHSTKTFESFPIAIAQMPITGDARKNGNKVRRLIGEAANKGARLIQFPEGTLSGYAKNPIRDWAEVNWQIVREELVIPDIEFTEKFFIAWYLSDLSKTAVLEVTPLPGNASLLLACPTA